MPAVGRASERPREEMEEEILSYNNVPVELAAKYLGVSGMYIRCGLRFKELPIGTAIMQSPKRYTYHISPYKLLSYQNGD